MQAAATLEANLSNLSASDREFAGSLLRQLKLYGRLSDKQRPWVQKLADRATGAKPATVHLGDLSGIVALFGKAGAKLKHPAIVLDLSGQPVRLSVGGAASKYPGAIHVATKGAFEDRTYFGRIATDGTFHPTMKAPDGLADLLARFAAEPAKVAAEYGHATGACCFCSRELTDARSLDVGYGPVCAGAYGLPWGAPVAGQGALF